MKTNKINGFNHSGAHNDDGPDFSSFNGFLNSILAHHNPPHAPPPVHAPSPSPTPPPPTPNSAGTDFARIGSANFLNGDGHTMVDGPNPRDISNIVVAGHGDDANPQGLS